MTLLMFCHKIDSTLNLALFVQWSLLNPASLNPSQTSLYTATFGGDLLYIISSFQTCGGPIYPG